MRILITGVAGHIGSRMAQWIVDHVPNVSIVGLDNLSSGYRENVPAHVEFHPFDLALGNADEYFQEVDYVIHAAAYASEVYSHWARKHTLTNNIRATAEVINQSVNHNVKRLVFLSSIAVYGDQLGPFRESQVCHPQDPYGISKLASELDLMCAANQDFQLQYQILRLGNVYGPYQSLWQRTRNVFGLWCAASLRGNPLIVYGDGQQCRPFTYIDDVLPAIWEATCRNLPSNRYNVCSWSPMTLQSTAEVFADVSGNRRIEYHRQRAEVKHIAVDSEAAARDLNFAPRTGIAAGLQHMWQWARLIWDAYEDRRSHTPPAREIWAGPCEVQ